MATHSRILGWRIPWTEEQGRLQNTLKKKNTHKPEHYSQLGSWQANPKMCEFTLNQDELFLLPYSWACVITLLFMDLG